MMEENQSIRSQLSSENFAALKKKKGDDDKQVESNFTSFVILIMKSSELRGNAETCLLYPEAAAYLAAVGVLVCDNVAEKIRAKPENVQKEIIDVESLICIHRLYWSFIYIYILVIKR